ncbi:Cu-binding protein [Coemansia thaxteri]|nr:Cu-binding protein [Coemansia thaxteri]KAJ2471925.1 Cu-binding protein [Coemansia sp. RSA 2322]
MRGVSSLVRNAARAAPSFLGRSQIPSSAAGAVGFARQSHSRFTAVGSTRQALLTLRSPKALPCRRAYSTEQPVKEKEPVGESGNSGNKGGGTNSFLLSTGPLSPIGIGLFVLTSAGIVYFFTVTKEQVRAEREKNKNKQETVGKADVGGPFELTDQDGNVATDRTFRGKFALIYFGFCHCPDICPDELDKIGDALDMLDRNPKTKDAIQPVFITCDPQRDSPEDIKQYLKQFHPRFVGLTGSLDQVAATCKAFRVYFSKPPKVAEGQDYLVDHSIFSYFMDPDGEFIDVYGKDKSALAMASDMEMRIGQFLDAGRKIQK